MRFPDLYENDPVGGRHFRMNGSKARFDTEAKRNSEMAYYQLKVEKVKESKEFERFLHVFKISVLGATQLRWSKET